jgi:uncharacterized protein Usg
MDRSFVVQLDGYRVTTAEIFYWMPDHQHILQSFIWQNIDLAPKFPNLTRFLEFWQENIQAKVHRVQVSNALFVKPATFRFAGNLYQVH